MGHRTDELSPCRRASTRWGTRGPESPVLVSANYKLSFDRLRGVLSGRDAWILVLDTHGINVWCAAGKGTFGTDEIVRRVQGTALDRIVRSRTLVVPQLGAPGVSAHLVLQRCGFRVVYGPVRVEDLPAFLDAGMKAEPEMRRVRFDLRDRAVLIPVELVMGAKYALLLAAAILLLSGLGLDGYSLARVRATGLPGAGLILGSFLCAAVLGPMLLPWLPGRAFSIKGAALGLAQAGAWAILGGPGMGAPVSWLHAGGLDADRDRLEQLRRDELHGSVDLHVPQRGAARDALRRAGANRGGGRRHRAMADRPLRQGRGRRMRYLEGVVTLEFDGDPLQRLRHVHQGLSARGVSHGEQAGRRRRPRSLHGVRSLREELRARRRSEFAPESAARRACWPAWLAGTGPTCDCSGGSTCC